MCPLVSPKHFSIWSIKMHKESTFNDAGKLPTEFWIKRRTDSD